MRKRILGIFLTIVLATSCFFSDYTAASVEAVANADVCITLDGDLLDWDFIKKTYESEGRMLQVASFQTDDSVYIMRELGSDLNLYGGEQMFFDTNGNATDGYTNAGIDWMLQGGSMYKYTGANGGWGWEDVGSYNDGKFTRVISSDNATGEYVIPLTTFDDYAGGTIRVNVEPYDGSWGTFASSGFAAISKYEDVYTESDAEPITNVSFTATGGKLQAITEATMKDGVVGTFSADGGDGTFKYSFATSAVYGVDNDKFVIDGNKLIVKDTLLSPGSYSVYLRVKSDVRTVKAAVTFVVESAAAGTPITEPVFTGQAGQWFAVNYNAANTIPTLNGLKAATDGNYLYAYVDAVTLSHNAAFYIGTSATTGADITDTWADADSIEYKVDMEGSLYAYQNNDWTKVGTAQIFKTGVGAEIKVALADLGNATGEIIVGFKEGETCYLPNQGQKLYAVNTPIMEDMPAITFDGDPQDWIDAGVQPVATGEGTVGDLYAARDDEMLYVMTYLSDVTEADWTACTALSTNFVINVDGDATTGFQHAAYPKGSGVDFLLQDWYSVGSSQQNVEFFFTTESGGGWQNKEAHMEGVYKKYREMEDGVYCVEYAIPIAKMKQFCNTVSDDIYVAVHRSESIIGLQSGTKTGGTVSETGTLIHVPKYKTSVAVNVGDNAFADWTAVARVATNTATDSTCNLFATRSDERLYTLVTNDKGGLNTVNAYYISVDDNTGYSISGYEKIDYVVKDAKLFKMVADNTLSEALDDVWMSYYNNSIEMQMYLSQLGNPDTIKINWRGCSGSMTIPADGSLMNVTAEFDMVREDGYFYPVEDFGSYSNPYKGWAIWGLPGETIQDWDNGLYHFESNLIYIALTWKDLQPESDSYDDFDKNLRNHLDRFDVEEWVARGKRINLRFMMDNTDYVYAEYSSKPGTNWSYSTWNSLKAAFEKNPNDATAVKNLQNYYENYLKFERMDIPMWLYEELVEFDKQNGGDGSGAGVFYWDRTGSELGIGYDQAGFAPNYYSEKLIERHAEIIAKIAEYWDNNEITGHVMIGSLGHWGEFHVWPEGSGVWPDVETLEKYVQPYIDNFKNVKLGIRKPYPIAAENNLGLFNDIFGVEEWGLGGTRDFYGFFMNGNTDMGNATGYDGMFNSVPDGVASTPTSEQIAASKMPDFWKYNWSGGEFANGQIRVHMTNDTALDGSLGTMGVLDETRFCHVSWMGPCGPSNYMIGEIDAVMHDANVLAMQKLMGYNFALEKITQVDTIETGKAVDLSMTWNNQGVAPFYYEWPLEFSLLNADGRAVYRQVVSVEDANITEWLPGRHEVDTAFKVPSTVAEGEYTLAVAILDKDTLAPSIRLLLDANDELRHPLYKVNVVAGSGDGTEEPETPETPDFELEYITRLDSIKTGKDVKLSMTFSNQGDVALNKEMPLELSLLNADGKMVYRQIVSLDDVNITEWFPGSHKVETIFNVPSYVGSGKFTLAVAFLDKDTNEPALKLNNDANDELRHPMYELSVVWIDPNPSTTPEVEAPTTTPETEAPTTTPEVEAPTTTPEVEVPTTDDETSDDVTSDDVVTEETVKVEVENLTDEIKDADEGTVFEADMTEDAVLNADVVEKLAESKVEVVLNIGNGISWTINSADVTNVPTTSIDLKVTLHTQNIPTDLVESVKEAVQEAVAEVVEFNIAHSGDFGFKAMLTLPVGKANHGKKATLFYHNTETGTMDNMGDNKVDKDGNVRFPFTHASDYVIVLSGAADDVPAADTDADVSGDADVDADTTTPDASVDTDKVVDDAPAADGGSSLWIIIAIIAVALIAAGVCVFQFVIKKKGEDGDE